ncbi:MAG TPA: hypothetical protein VKN18_02330 [Blastocatellia bacterium]|nr:hypothetical protein [Blastocatellia bacterium]
MSRLDDELRKAFRREQPSADFTQRLLEQVATQPLPKARWWQRLATLVEPPKLRWVAIGITASLLLAIGAAQYQRLSRVVTEENQEQAKASEPAAASPVTREDPDKKNAPARQDAAQPATVVRQTNKPGRRHRALVASSQKVQELKAEGEAAKEKLMFALSIASSAVNDAQKAVHDDGLNP